MYVQQRSGEAAYFQRFQGGGVNFCAFPVPYNDPPVKTWPSMPSLNSTGVTRETKECALYCLQSPVCVTYQVVRTGSGVGFCHVVPLLSGVQISDEGTCKSFLMREKKLDCIIRWNPQNFKTRYNKNVFRVERLDKSWSVYNETRGIHILELDINKCVPAKHSIFDTKLGTSERSKFQNYLDKSVSMGTYLIGFSVNDFLDNSMILFLSRYFRISYDFYESLLWLSCVRSSHFLTAFIRRTSGLILVLQYLLGFQWTTRWCLYTT